MATLDNVPGQLKFWKFVLAFAIFFSINIFIYCKWNDLNLTDKKSVDSDSYNETNTPKDSIIVKKVIINEIYTYFSKPELKKEIDSLNNEGKNNSTSNSRKVDPLKNNLNSPKKN